MVAFRYQLVPQKPLDVNDNGSGRSSYNDSEGRAVELLTNRVLSNEDSVQVKRHSSGGQINRWTLVAIITTLANLFASAWLLFIGTTQFPADASKTLRVGDQFYGLSGSLQGGLMGPSTSPLTTFPTLLQQIDYNNPNFVYPNDPRRYRSYFGVISPEDRPLYISSSVSTVAQFRIRDYWMGRCTLKIALPLDRKFASNSSMPSLQRERDWIGFTGAVRLTIWTLEIPKNIQSLWLNPRTLNARTRPSRGRKFAEVYIEAGSDFRSEPFSCKRDSVISFELSCEDCVLDVWQDKQMPPVGLSLEQHFGAQ